MRDSIQRAFEALKEGLDAGRSPAVALTADTAGAVLLHMALSVRADVPVIYACDRADGPERLKYAQKLARMLGAAVLAVPAYADVREAARSVASESGVGLLFAAWEPGGGNVPQQNPLEGVPEGELADYIVSHGLPEYPAETFTAAPPSGGEEDSEVADKLKSLGYM